MGRLLSIDFGRKRCGIAVTDPLRIAANPLETVRTCDLVAFLTKYCAAEAVDKIIVGLPTTLRGEPSESQRWLRPAMAQVQKALPEMPIEYYDERFTSVLAHRAMLDGGLGKMARRDKATVDRVSAAILLNDYLQAKLSLNSAPQPPKGGVADEGI